LQGLYEQQVTFPELDPSVNLVFYDPDYLILTDNDNCKRYA